MENHFVVHSPAAQRMRMTDQRRKFSVGVAGVEQRFQSTSRAFEKK
jgi:hypothetical protein